MDKPSTIDEPFDATQNTALPTVFNPEDHIGRAFMMDPQPDGLLDSMLFQQMILRPLFLVLVIRPPVLMEVVTRV